MGSIKMHEHYNTTTDDEHSHLDTSSEEEHSPMDYQCTPMPPPSSPCNMEYTITAPTPHPRRSKTCPIYLPRPSKANNNNTIRQETTEADCQMSTQRKVPAKTHPQPRRIPFFNYTTCTSHTTKQENIYFKTTTMKQQ